MVRRKARLDHDRYMRTLRRWSVWGCLLGLVLYAWLLRFDSGLTGKPLFTRALAGISFALMGIIIGRLLMTYFYDTEG